MNGSTQEMFSLTKAHVASVKRDGEFSALVTLRLTLDDAAKMGVSEGREVLFGYPTGPWIAVLTVGTRGFLLALVMTGIMEIGDAVKESAHDLANAIRAAAAGYEAGVTKSKRNTCPTEDSP